MDETGARRALLLSIGYGEGHHAAARAAEAELQRRQWETRRVDVCAETHPAIFRLTQRFYHFCVRRAPWLWGVAYAQTETADWAVSVRMPLLRGCCARLKRHLEEFRPDAVICTYPLFAYMLDALRAQGVHIPPYAVVVTDSLEISRPWMLSEASLFCLPDEYSAKMVCERYPLPPERVAVSGFPVSPAFRESGTRSAPTPDSLHIVYGAYASLSRVVEDVRGMLALFPRARISVLAGERAERLRGRLCREAEAGSVDILKREEDMAALFARAHLYIGKAGAATLYEAYSAVLPCIVNYALPGQEQGNKRLLLRDGAGLSVEGTRELLQALAGLMAHQAAAWSELAAAMKRAKRSHGAERLADLIEQRLLHYGS